MSENLKKIPQSVNLTPRAKSNLDQLVNESGMGKSEIISKLLVDYFDSIQKKICV